MIERLINWLIRRGRETNYQSLEGYMERLWLLPRWMLRWDVHGGFYELRWPWLPAVRLHHILRSDFDRHLHDHPWSYITVILRGGYTEVTPWVEHGPWRSLTRDDGRGGYERFAWYGPGSILIRGRKHKHRLELPTDAWTLFITGPKLQGWGFFVKGIKVPAREYLQ